MSRSRQPAEEPETSSTRTRHPRGSLLPKVLLGVAVVLVISSASTYMLETRLTRSALEGQAVEMLQNDLETLRASLVNEYSELISRLRTAEQAVFEADTPERQADLVSELGRIRRDFGLDLVNTLHSDGTVRVAIGSRLAPLPPDALEALTATPLARLIPTADGGYALVALVSVGRGTDQFVLAGGQLFDDGAAYRMRGQIRHDVLLAADGRLVGSSLARPLAEVPMLGRDRALPQQATTTSLDGQKTFVGYAPIAAADGTWAPRAAVGVVLPDPVAALDQSLGRNRMATVALLMAVALGLSWLFFRQVTRPLLALSKTAQRVEAGDLDASFTVRSRDEIGHLAGSLEEMRLDLRGQLNVIGAQATALRESSRRIVNAYDDERQRVAADLHDGLQRRLVMLRLQAGTMVGMLDREHEAQTPRLTNADAQTIAHALADEIEAVLQALREVGQNLFPSILADRGLDGALHSLGSRASIPLQITTHPKPLPRLPREVEANAYFLISEALSNVLKHADATHVAVEAVVADDVLRVSVTDNGKGLDPDAVRKVGGLSHMRDRASATGGSMEVASALNGGTVVRASFHVTAPDDRLRASPGRALQVEQNGSDAPVDVEIL